MNSNDDKNRRNNIWVRILLIVLAIIVGSSLIGGGVYYKLKTSGEDGTWNFSLEFPGEDGGEDSTTETAPAFPGTESALVEPENGSSISVPETFAVGEPMIQQAQVVDSAGETRGAVVVVDVSQVVEQTLPSVVAITNTRVYENYTDYYGFYLQNGGTYEVTGSGSGIILGDNGSELWIITNQHVVKESSSLVVTFCDETTANARVINTDSVRDLAVVAVSLSELDDETRETIRSIVIGDSEQLRMGEGVIAIGNALGFGQSVTTGCISALNRQIQNSDGRILSLIQTDAAINPGNSGGALLDQTGKLIGINVAKLSDQDVEGMGFAIPVSQAMEMIDSLTGEKTDEKQTVSVDRDSYPYLGLQLKDVTANMVTSFGMPAGVMVYYAEEGGPAAEAGILANDIITALDGKTVMNYEELDEILSGYTGGSEVKLTIQRMENGAYRESELTVVLGFQKDHL